MKHRILFLCTGNICRSPAAHCIFQHYVDQESRSRDFEIDSSGTIAFHAGEPPDPRMREALRARNIPVFGKARPLASGDLRHYDLILAMDRENLNFARQMDASGEHQSKIRLFSGFCTKHQSDEVPDPYYGGDAGFEKVLDMIEDGCSNLLKSSAFEKV
ncbi:MAG: low molecular weight protein-tyrosine-phosphatase [Opitutales bacterium]